MKKIFFIFAVFIISSNVFAQSEEQKISSVQKDLVSNESLIKEKGQFSSDIEESLYYAPIRYVIVYNETISLGSFSERQIDILFDEKSFTKKNLLLVFKQIAKKYPSPEGLQIKLHTTLETIETPEEKNMTRISHNNRFRNHYDRFKNALYFRNKVTGLETFNYTNLSFLNGYETVEITKDKIN